MARLIIHVGSHKTGTTSIQTHLDQIRETLPALGYSYPELPKSHIHKISHFNILRQFFGRDESKKAETVKFLKRAHESPRDVILSAESLFGQPTKRPRETDAQYWQRKADTLVELREHFPGRQTQVVIFLRDRQAYMTSLFRQLMRVHQNPAASIEEMLEDYLSKFGVQADYQSQVNAWRIVFDKVTVVDYDQLCDKSSVHRFCSILGIPVPENDLRENTSVDWAGVEIRRSAMLDNSGRTSDDLSAGERAALNQRIAAIVETRIVDYLKQANFGLQVA